MDLQYLSDIDGKHTAVVIPIEEWNDLTKTYIGLKSLEKSNVAPKKTKKPSDFVGCISKEQGQEMIKDLDKSRNQWERNI